MEKNRARKNNGQEREVGGGKEDQEGGDILYLQLIHVDVWQKPTQCCKAIILQLKINKFKKELYT